MLTQENANMKKKLISISYDYLALCTLPEGFFVHKYDNSFEQLTSSIIGVSSSRFTFALKHPNNSSPLFGSLSAKQDDFTASFEDSQPCSICTSSKLLAEKINYKITSIHTL